MKEIVIPGQQIRVGCESCQAMRAATFRYDTLHLPDGTQVPHAMLAFCDVCGSEVAMAQQSAHLVRQARQPQRKKTSVRVSRVLWDLASVLVLEAGGDPHQGSALELVLKAVLASVLEQPQRRQQFATRLRALREDPLLAQPAEQKVNLGLTPRMLAELTTLQQAAQMSKPSQVIRASLVAARHDPRVERELRKLVALTT